MKTKLLILLMSVIVGTLILAGCAQPMAADACPEAGEGAQLLRDEEGGYCLLYPEGYELGHNDRVILAPPETEGHRERLFINIEDASGKTTEQAVDELVAEFTAGMPDFQAESSSITIDGEPAFVLHNLPGQDVNRRLVMVHDGRLYDLMFVPSDEAAGEAYEQMETLYERVIASFKFIPQP